ncbi:peptidoglycan DD-metalloendopeptidase family protein [Legionella pneumophila serogroup 1]|uniref:Peptidoglycan DD-metalloendopeptidase family protein n=1 Tax=Legionella pneumophila TaxID=446 RepID=A0AAP3HCF2_LEGPN|nr:peptidoglycan DD-metalloendopeptidase family protein [Legionella pneumophila]HAT8842234.1 peptidoglycan DD-metalloendopeptidase family protein [Legionella pneumophila subsp. pneumophila]MCW8467192.1 peptidoglycan DD-metalloendopeptidase family protein [Legionella pneumophila]MCW8476860.1 peptidoglycan DD-metalloendopeptidase family protein [Legionella pneumophila]MCZ4680655.1 peptidoglycan DD-metalloendopeptidase family protein [Legionella pneumophila]MCZ4688005.1 peptidoglycan DD-metalloen
MMRLFRKQLICIFFILSVAGCGTRSDLAPVTELKWQPYSKYQKFHTVRSGETLYAIAFRYDTDYRRLAIINHLRPPYSLRVGQVLSLKGIVPKSNHFHSAPRANLHITHKPKQKVIYSPAYNVRSSSGWLWPVTGRVVTTFIPSQGKKGINIACNRGDKVRASASGVVAYAGSGLPGYGNLIIIKHSNEYLTAYGNNARNLVTEGQRVSAGQVIAEAGLIDRSYWGVHFEIRRAGVPVNPLNYLQKG